MATSITPITQEYIVDMSSNNNFIQIPSVQGDGDYTRYVQLTLVENGQLYTIPSDVGIYVAGNKPDNKTIFNSCEKIDAHRVKFEITSQMSAAVGRGEYQIVFIDTNVNSQIKSFPFYLITTRSFNAEEMVSSNEYQAIAELVRQMQEDYSHYVVECQASADAASVSESNAATSEANAATSESNAHTSETNAATSEANAKTSEDNAKASELAAKDSETNASTSETNAHTSEVNAKTSETNAKTSETNAATSEVNAATSETNALASENASKASEDAAKESEIAAATSEANALTSETNAKTSETNAKTSELNAKESENNAAASAVLAESWAVGGTDTRTGEDTNNAKYWAERAADWGSHDASNLTYTFQDGTVVNLADFLKVLEDADGETFLLL